MHEGANAGLPLSIVAEMPVLYLPDGVEYADLTLNRSRSPVQLQTQPMPEQVSGRNDGSIKRDAAHGIAETPAPLDEKRPGRDMWYLTASDILNDEKVAISAQVKAEAQPSETGSPFELPTNGATHDDYLQIKAMVLATGPRRAGSRANHPCRVERRANTQPRGIPRELRCIVNGWGENADPNNRGSAMRGMNYFA